MKTQLTKEQSQHLIDLGVSKGKASKVFLFNKDKPIFTLTDLLDLLPSKIKHDNKEATLSMQFIDDGWSCQYDGLVAKGAISYKEELIDALYELTICILKNKHLKL